MAIVKSIFSNFCAFLMAMIITAVPYAGVELPIIKTLDEDCLLNVEIMSDVHIEEKELIRQLFLVQGLKNLKCSKSPVDAILITGDITNYADEPSLAKYYDLIGKHSPAPVITVAGNHDIGHASDLENYSREEALASFIRYRNEYMKRSDTENYFSTEVNGYKFIIIGDEVIDGGSWDDVTMSKEQLDFIDRELAEGTKNGKPVFVCSHWPMKAINGESVMWEGSGIDPAKYDIKGIMEKYKNVFYISGHMHSGIKAKAVEEVYGLSNAEQVNGVTYINLPTYGIINMFGTPWSGIGAQLEVYENEVVFRPRNFITNKWFTNAVYHFELK